MVSLRDGEIAGRRQLEELGLTASEQLNSKRRKSRPAADEEEDYECEKCRMSLFISYVSSNFLLVVADVTTSSGLSHPSVSDFEKDLTRLKH